MRHRRKLRATFGKDPVKHSSTLVDNTGPGVGSFFAHVLYKTDVGLRISSGGVQTIRDTANTEEVINVGDVIKYMNICLEASPRGTDPTILNDNAGWLEWAVCWQQEPTQLVVPTVANIGILTLGVICSHIFRQNCLMTGCFPIGTRQAMSQDIKIKLPQKCVKILMGSRLTIFCYIRTSKSTDTRTDSHRLIASSHFKCYS